MKTQLIAIAALSGFCALGAQAFAGEQNPLPPTPFHSMVSRASVQAQALHATPFGNGGTGVMTIAASTDRSAVRAGAIAMARTGVSGYGEGTDRPM